MTMIAGLGAALLGLQAGGPIRVPEDRPTLQAAVDAARDGDTVFVSPGLYRENVRIRGKTITLASRFLQSRDPRDIERTAIDGGGRTVITVEKDAGPQTRIVGFTLQNGVDGICLNGAWIQILHNRLRGHRKVALRRLRADPLLSEDFEPRDGSPCIDAGVATYEHLGRRVLELPRDSFLGPAPDLGALERR